MVTPPIPTCKAGLSESIIDYFIVSLGLITKIQGFWFEAEDEVSPHRPWGLLLGGKTRATYTRVFKLPRPFPSGEESKLDGEPLGARTATGADAGLIAAGTGSAGSRGAGSAGCNHAGSNSGRANPVGFSAPNTTGTTGFSTTHTTGSNTFVTTGCSTSITSTRGSGSGSGSGGAAGATGSGHGVPGTQPNLVQVQEWPILVGATQQEGGGWSRRRGWGQGQ